MTQRGKKNRSSAQHGPACWRRHAVGFTLIELLVVVVVIAILAAIAYPSYDSHVIRTNRSVAQQFLMTVANRQEQYRLDANSYTGTLGAGGLALTAPAETAGRYTFAITVTGGPPPGYTVTATAIGPQAGDGPLTLASDGTKSPIAKWQK